MSIFKAQYVDRNKDGSFSVIGWDKDFAQKTLGEELTHKGYKILRDDITGWADMTHLIECDGAWYLAEIEE